MIKNKNILIGASSSIAIFKIKELVSKLKREKANIKLVMTENAKKLIKAEEFDCEVITKLFRDGFDYKKYLKSNEYKHLSLAKWADLTIIAPATANTIGKIAYGIADDLLTTTIMSTKSQIIICPAMNANMYNNTIVQKNIKKLQNLGYWFIGPASGHLACGDEGKGRLENIDIIFSQIKKYFEKKDKLKGKKIIVTAGATSEEIDPVRTITNKSSGKTGIFIAEQAAKLGADVTLIRGNTSIEPTYKMKDIKINSVDELYNEIKKNIKNKDVMIHAAAVSDFTIKKSLKKISSKNKLSLKLKPTIKIINNIKKLNKNIFLVGFKLSDGSKNQLINDAYKLLKESKSNLVIANNTKSIDSENSEIFIINKNKRIVHIKSAPKRIIAEKIIKHITQIE